MKIYLAGGKSNWRDDLAKRKAWKDHELIDPFKHSRQGAIYQFTNDDLAHIADSDLIFCYCDYHIYTGCALEFGYAHALGKKIVYVCTQPRVDSMMAAVASYVFTDFEAAVEFVEGRVFA